MPNLRLGILPMMNISSDLPNGRCAIQPLSPFSPPHFHPSDMTSQKRNHTRHTASTQGDGGFLYSAFEQRTEATAFG
jgi:hypothetical protein